MLSSVLRSETAIQVNINIMRAFVAMRHAVAAMQSADMKVEQLAHKVDQMDAHIDELMHEQRDINREQTETNNEVALQIEAINNALDQLREKPAPKRNKIGYKTKTIKNMKKNNAINSIYLLCIFLLTGCYSTVNVTSKARLDKTIAVAEKSLKQMGYKKTGLTTGNNTETTRTEDYIYMPNVGIIPYSEEKKECNNN